MQLVLRDPMYTDRLASFLASVGQRPVVAGPDAVELFGDAPDEETRLELEIYLRVWRVLYPEAHVELAA
ncbi:MAG: hypothetical protein JOZ56_08430 [Actinobacteria bacterium]|nr:hypothetical protein [Actinomycetota bacterium]MBV8563102.1 hypothetical protein [Actinomycetota bacterium]